MVTDYHRCQTAALNPDTIQRDDLLARGLPSLINTDFLTEPSAPSVRGRFESVAGLVTECGLGFWCRTELVVLSCHIYEMRWF